MNTKNNAQSSKKALVFTIKFIIISTILIGIALLYNLFAAEYVSNLFDGYIYTEAEVNDAGIIWPVVIIDAGHGGMDSGAVGINGIYEKELNLKISFIIYDMLRANGVPAIMTRTEDKMLYTESQNIKGQRKMYDLKNRLLVAENNPGAVFVSIHMNRFPQQQYSGLQVYYSKSDATSVMLAQKVQKYTKEYLQSNNNREIKPSNSNIYILERIKNPAVLVECGFISNAQECEKLCSEDYQKELSAVIFYSVMNFLNENRVQSN